LEKNLDARQRELERESELDEMNSKVKAKSKMSKVSRLAAGTTPCESRQNKVQVDIHACNFTPDKQKEIFLTCGDFLRKVLMS